MINHTKMISFITVNTNVRLLLILCVLDPIEQMDLSEFMMDLDI